MLYSIRFLPLKGLRDCPWPDNHFQQCASSLPRWWQQHASVPKSWKHMFFNFPPSVFLRVYWFVCFQNNFHLFHETIRPFVGQRSPLDKIHQLLKAWPNEMLHLRSSKWKTGGELAQPQPSISKRPPQSSKLTINFLIPPPSGMCWQQSSWSYRHFGNQRDPWQNINFLGLVPTHSPS